MDVAWRRAEEKMSAIFSSYLAIRGMNSQTTEGARFIGACPVFHAYVREKRLPGVMNHAPTWIAAISPSNGMT